MKSDIVMLRTEKGLIHRLSCDKVNKASATQFTVDGFRGYEEATRRLGSSAACCLGSGKWMWGYRMEVMEQASPEERAYFKAALLLGEGGGYAYDGIDVVQSIARLYTETTDEGRDLLRPYLRKMVEPLRDALGNDALPAVGNALPALFTGTR